MGGTLQQTIAARSHQTSARTERVGLPSALASLVSVVILAFIAVAGVSAVAGPSEAQLPIDGGGWLETLNAHRLEAGLAPVAASDMLSSAATEHARYLVANQQTSGMQDPSLPESAEAGAEAARNSVVVTTGDDRAAEQELVRSLLSSPFKALRLLRADLASVGFGVARSSDSDDDIRAAAVIDVLRGLDAAPGPVEVARTWPADGSTTSMLTANLDGLAHLMRACGPAMEQPGLPILVWTPHDLDGATAEVRANDQPNPLPTCDLSPTMFPHVADAHARATWMRLLEQDNVMILIPRQPLPPDSTITVRLNTHRGIERTEESTFHTLTRE